MLRISLVASLVAVGLLFVMNDDALGHGGTYRGPGDVQGPPDPGGPPTPGGGGPTTPGGGGPTTPGGGGPTTPGGGTGNGPGGPGGPGGGKGATTGQGGSGGKRNAPGVEGFESWTYWWEYNRHRFVNVRASLADGNTSTGNIGFLTGHGDKGGATASSRPTADEVNTIIVPALKGVLGASDADIVDAAVLALGRIVERESAAVCLDELQAALASKHNSVQESTLLALGVLGSKDAIPVLVDVLGDTPEGRKALRVNGQIQDTPRAFAALALGYIGSPETISILQHAIVKNTDTEKSIRAAAIVALGQFEDGKETIVSFLLDLLQDEKMHQDTAAQIPVALARLGAVAAIPELRRLATSRKTEARVEESCVIALGMLAQPQDKEVVADLMDKIKDGSNDQGRHFAIMALSQIAERALTENASDDDQRRVRDIADFLLKEMMDSKRKAHEPWAGLALAIVGSKYAEKGRDRNEIALRLLEKFENTSNPSPKSAYALGLGILRETGGARPIMETLTDSPDAMLQGYCAVALGLLRHPPANGAMRRLLVDAQDPKLRFQVATGLGLMGDSGATSVLLSEFAKTKVLMKISSLAAAIGLIGDRSAVEPLEQLIADERMTGVARGFGCVALGLLAEKTELPWNAAIAININYRAQITSLKEALDIL